MTTDISIFSQLLNNHGATALMLLIALIALTWLFKVFLRILNEERSRNIQMYEKFQTLIEGNQKVQTEMSRNMIDMTSAIKDLKEGIQRENELMRKMIRS